MNTCIKYLEISSEKYSNKTAIVEESRQVTFSELKDNSLKISSLINKEYRNNAVGIFLPKSIAAIECFMGTLYSGNFYAPLDVKSPIERVKNVISNLKPKIIITNSTYFKLLYDNFSNIDIEIINIDEVDFDIKVNNPQLYNRVIDTDPIYCIYTSGSTGIPKGVLINHRGVEDYIEWAVDCYKINDKDILGSQAPFYFDNSTLDIYLMLKTGAKLELINDFLFSFPHKLIDHIIDRGINTIFWVPSIMNMVMNTDALSNKNVPLAKILFAGEVMPVKVLNYWKRNIKDAIYSNLYGPTEITVDCTYYIIDREFSEQESLPIGFPCLNTNVIILDEFNNVCKNGEIGELCVRGSSLALGYINNLEKTNEVFIQNPLNNSYPEKIYKTGDLVKLNDKNEIIYIGRKDSQIKHLGYRIELGEIENAVNSILEISNMCVLYEENIKEICLFYESSNSGLSKVDIIMQISKLVPKYMVPSTIIKVDKMPLNPNGKIDRILLKKKLINNDYE